jgi:hypothetical protein
MVGHCSRNRHCDEPVGLAVFRTSGLNLTGETRFSQLAEKPSVGRKFWQK